MKAVLTTFPFNVPDISLASLVPKIASPHQNALQLDRTLDLSEISDRRVNNFSDEIIDLKDSGFLTKLTDFVSFSSSSSQATGLKLDSLQGRVYQLKQPSALFQELCAQARQGDKAGLAQEGNGHVASKAAEQKQTERQQRLEKKYQAGLSEYFITGYCTFLDANMEASQQDSIAKTGSVKMPIGEVANAASAGAAGPLADKLNIHVEGAKHESHSEYSNLWAPGERIFAVSYERVTFKLFKRGDVDSASINGTTRWIMINQTRGVSPDNPQDAAGIEVGLEDLDQEEDELEPVDLGMTHHLQFLKYVGEDE
jgi:hypothetical protein